MTQNRLAKASSSYLRSGSHQPIDWYEFGEEAFQKAKESDRLILLDIGAVWCHWCHVIDRESYENDEIAQLINQYYVPVKVDRDQRPDIDARYQQIVASMTGQGGWPLTAFLTSDGRVLFGGTYFPPATMKKLLLQLKDVYQEQKETIMKDSLASASQKEIDAQLESTESEAQQPIPKDVFHRLLNTVDSAFDSEYGGFGMQPKFPHFSTLEFLIQQTFRTQNKELARVVEKSLTEMAKGGVYDQIGGGFHRYSVDRQWHVPHFEKMAYDNAEALQVYAQAYRLQPNPLYLDVIHGILHFTARVLSDQKMGGFYASQDADIDLTDDGDYFTWTLDEVKAVLTPEEAELVIAYYGLTPNGDMHGRQGRNVLHITKDIETVAKQIHQSVETVQQRLANAKHKMAAHRFTRTAPFVDQTQYLNWNGMYLVAYFETADLLDRPDVREFAQKTLDRLLETHVDQAKNCLLHTSGIPGLMEDYAWFIQALIKGYQSTENKGYLDAAQHWMQVAIDSFEDRSYGGFYDIATPTEDALALLKFRRKPTEDTPSSSANAVMIRNLIKLFLLTSETCYAEKAERALHMFGYEFSNRGVFVSALATALFEWMHPPVKLAVLGQDKNLNHASRTTFYPGKIVSYQPESSTSEVQICEGTRCLTPVTTVEALDSQLKALVSESLVSLS